ncbi:tyrosine--tRNA ligase [Microgenomates group bacterium]|nr:tyrosine--tRNA ligase [Microgenomates group bacterium]
MKKPTLEDIKKVLERGVEKVYPDVEGLAKLIQEKKIKLYLGIDPTGGTLHLGHGVVLRKLQQFAELGCETILLIGNGTVRIGDPTGKDSSRPMLTDEEIEQNFATWKRQASKILDFSKITIAHNGDWLDKLTYAQMVKLMAKTTVQQLMERDMFQQRIKDGLPIFGHEIIYPLLQGYDSVAMEVDLEIGGSDQTFNMLMGRHLMKEYLGREKFVLTTPIIDGFDGRKMSKSFGNFVALEAKAEEMYGKLMSMSDEMIWQYFEILTDEEMSNIKKMQRQVAEGENPMVFKKKLAREITKFYHGEEGAKKAAAGFERTVQNKELPEEMPEVVVERAGLSLLELARLAQPEESNANLKRLVAQGGVELVEEDVLRVGKRRYYRIVVK